MRLVEHPDPASFLDRAGAFLEAREAENNLLFGIVHTLRTEPATYAAFWLATVEDGGDVVGAALQTPPFNVLLTRMPAEGVAAVLAARPDAPGVTGPADTLQGGRGRVAMRQRIYECPAVLPVPRAPGRVRPATPSDEVVLDWRRAFHAEAGDFGPIEHAVTRFRGMVARGEVEVWEDGEPVAMAAVTGPTPHGIRVGVVYTPPARRRRGYATSLVAEATSAQLAAGRRFCFLFTDLDNPTSNAIYQAIGYRPVSDVTVVRFA